MFSRKTFELFVSLLALILSCVPEKKDFYPPPSEQQLKQALLTSNKAYTEGRPKEVVTRLEPLVNCFPPGEQLKEALRLLALSYYDLRQYEKSSYYFRELLGSFPESGTDKVIALNALRSFDKTAELERIPPLVEGLLKMSLSREERKEVVKIFAKSLGRAYPFKALKYYELLQREGVAEAQGEAFSVIEGLNKEQLMEVEKVFPNHPYGVFAKVTLSRFYLRERQPVKAFFVLESVKEKSKEKGLFEQWQKAWREIGTQVKSQVLKIRIPFGGKGDLQFLKGIFLAGGVFGEVVPWRIKFKFETPATEAPGTSLPSSEGLEKAVKGLLGLAKAEGLTEIALMVTGGTESERLKETVFKMAKTLGLGVSYLERGDKGKVERTKGLLLVGEDKDICSILAQSEVKGIKVFVLCPRDPSGLLKVCSRYLEGAFLACPFWPNSTREGLREFARAYRSIYGETPTYQAALGYFEVFKALDSGFRSPLEEPFLLKVARGSVVEVRR